MSDIEDTIRWMNSLCCGAGEPPEDAKTVAEWDREYANRTVPTKQPWFPPEWMICPGCIRFRFSPIHFCLRVIGICDGRNAC